MSKRRSYKRRGGEFRDITTFIIATEGAKREVQYFEALAAGQRRVKVRVIGAGDQNLSSPEQTLARAERQVTNMDPQPGDQVWLVLDTDRWTNKQLMTVSRACRDRAWGLTISNPCFELWLYLHYADLPEGYTGSGQDLKRDLGELCQPGGYSPATALPGLPRAIERAKALDAQPDLRLPPAYVTQVYRLAVALEAFIE